MKETGALKVTASGERPIVMTPCVAPDLDPEASS